MFKTGTWKSEFVIEMGGSGAVGVVSEGWKGRVEGPEEGSCYVMAVFFWSRSPKGLTGGLSRTLRLIGCFQPCFD